MSVQSTPAPYPATFDVAYPAGMSRMTTFFRLILAIPVLVLASLVATGLGFVWVALVLMLLFTGRYPRPWFDWNLYVMQFSARVNAYAMLLTDRYPSTTDEQSVAASATLDGGLSRWLPLVKWLLAVPHIVALYFLGIAAGVVTLIAWFAILFTGRYPRGLFDFVVGVNRWQWRLNAYVALLSTDRYPPFSLK